MRENRLRWFGHVMTREKMEAIRSVMEMNVEGRKGNPKKRWSDVVERGGLTHNFGHSLVN